MCNRILILLLVLSQLSVAVAQQALFAPAVGYAANDKPVQAVTADFNLDGHLDLLSTSFGSTSLSLHLGTGTGTFGTKKDIPVTIKSVSISLGDFNRDGKMDVVALSLDTYLVVLLGNGDGTFSPSNRYLMLNGQPRGLAVADFNGDGHLDVAAGNSSANKLSIFLGLGTGALSTRKDFDVGTSPYGLAVGDFNGDGKLDLISANDNGTASLLLGYGNGNFRAKIDINTGPGSRPRGIAVGDLNLDGNMDFAMTDFNLATVYVFLGKGDASFRASSDYPIGGNSRTIALADMNNDGNTDIITANEDDTARPAFNLSILLGKGDGTFGARTDYPTNTKTEGIVAADFNRDGQVDLTITDNKGANNNRILILLNRSLSTLPVQLHSLSARLLNHQNLRVDWKTESEHNNSHFLVQLSRNGSRWETIGRVHAKTDSGSHEASQRYTFERTVTGMTLAGIGLLGILFVPRSKKRWGGAALLMVTITVLAACAKMELDERAAFKLDTYQTLYVRIVQVDRDGTNSFSEGVVVKR